MNDHQRNPEYFVEPAARGSSSTKLYRRWPGHPSREFMCQHEGDHAECIEQAEAYRRHLGGRKKRANRGGIAVVHVDPALLSGLH